MIFDLEVPFTTDNGIQYLIKFRSFSPDRLPEGINIPVIDIVIETNAISDEIVNDSKSLRQITKIILDYIEDKQAVLYSFCSSKDIKKSKRNSHLSNQEFRSGLFTAMFNLTKSKNFINRVIVINDPDNGHHYLHLIGNVIYQEDIDYISKKLQEFDKPQN